MTHNKAPGIGSEYSNGLNEWLNRGLVDEMNCFLETGECPEGLEKLVALGQDYYLAAQTADEQDPDRLLAENLYTEEARRVYDERLAHGQGAA